MTVVKVSAVDAVSCAILRHLGIDERRCTSITYSHTVGEIPTVTVEMYVWDADGKFVIEDDGPVSETVRYEWRPVEWEPVQVARWGDDYAEVALT